MNIRKYLDLFSKDLELIYNSESTRTNYHSQISKFLYRFKSETEPKAISSQEIKEWLLEAKTTQIYTHISHNLISRVKTPLSAIA